jgi:hypothetical protein
MEGFQNPKVDYAVHHKGKQAEPEAPPNACFLSLSLIGVEKQRTEEPNPQADHREILRVEKVGDHQTEYARGLKE